MPDPVSPIDVLVVGSVNIDHVVEADRFPSPGQTIFGRTIRSSVGGKGANQAVAAALSGAHVAFAGRVGDDERAGSALAALSEHGVDVSLTSAAPGPTGAALITVTPQDNTIIVVSGANALWPDPWPDPPARAALARARVVLAQLEVPLAVVDAAARAATGARFVLNAAPASAVPDELLARCDVLVVNEHELAAVAGRPGPPAEAHAGLLSRGVGSVVTTLGPRGAVVTDSAGTCEVASPVAPVVDTTGAGDAFTGVLCARLAARATLVEAVRWAAAAGSLAVRGAGTHASYPDKRTIAALVARTAKE